MKVAASVARTATSGGPGVRRDRRQLLVGYVLAAPFAMHVLGSTAFYAFRAYHRTLLSLVRAQSRADAYASLLAWSSTVIPPNAGTMVVLIGSTPDVDDRYHRASSQLYPRAVWMGSVEELGSRYPSFEALNFGLATRGIQDLLVSGVAPSDLRLDGRVDIVWYSRDRLQYVARLPGR